ncbi:Spo0E like sporulation regulatory protein [Paenibacillus sp. yr247]|uniref:Spo0E family sporulation regulatory protein-aspartic acid phosphatase n=1 Tax=Paenibacillus sp. yr247 TaxID=1761880 RepID=UPI000883C18A|nr:Spo0E family sporulation regulatory protein-aspartic acid phosphatase [Paenibacillus sp. yr247]SDP01669.1 Spo0E like sporulation regulatory protein [Paenibacillus sp. yr247]
MVLGQLSIAKEIESAKLTLNLAAANNGYDFSDHELLQLSHKLDQLIIEFYRLQKSY